LSDIVHPDIILGRRVRCHTVDIGRGVVIHVLEAADADVVLESAISSGDDPYAAILWPSALAAAARLPELLDTRDAPHVLDVSAGTGLVALVAARLGARATALDHDAFARAVIAESAALNGVAVAVADFDLASTAPLPAADLVVMADLLYEPDLSSTAAVRALEALSAGARVLVGDPARQGREAFIRELAEAGVTAVFDDVVIRVPGEPQPARAGLALLQPAGTTLL
jgi:predicted nicotinamide N-methyase